jgi:hypothetical protein
MPRTAATSADGRSPVSKFVWIWMVTCLRGRVGARRVTSVGGAWSDVRAGRRLEGKGKGKVLLLLLLLLVVVVVVLALALEKRDSDVTTRGKWSLGGKGGGISSVVVSVEGKSMASKASAGNDTLTLTSLLVRSTRLGKESVVMFGWLVESHAKSWVCSSAGMVVLRRVRVLRRKLHGRFPPRMMVVLKEGIVRSLR